MSFPRLDDLDHRRVGAIWLATALVVFILGAVLAVYLHSELAGAGETLLPAADYARAMTAHGLLMAFLVLVPIIPGVLGHLVLPGRLGVEALASPRLSAMALAFYVSGAVVAMLAGFFGGLESGWDFFGAAGPVPALLAFGLTLVAASLAACGLNFILTVHRAENASVMGWTLYAAAVLQIAALAILAVGLSKLSGDVLQARSWFWMFTQTWLASSVVAAVGVVAETLARCARKPVFAPRTLSGAAAALGVVASMAWGRHLFGSGADVDATVHSGFALLMVVPAAVIAVAWLGTLYGGAIRFSAALGYALGAAVLFAVTSLGGLFTATPGPGALLRGTLYHGAHLHYLSGGVLMAFLAGLHAWWPAVSGRLFAETGAKTGALLVFLGFNAAFAPRLLMGLRGAYAGWDGLPGDLGWLSVIGGWLLTAGLAVLIAVLLASMRDGPVADGR